MPRIRKQNITVGFHPQTFGKLSEIADELQTTMNDIIRQCVENDLPKLIERERKRRKRRTFVH